MRGFKNFKGSDARCPSIHFLFYASYSGLSGKAYFIAIIAVCHFIRIILFLMHSINFFISVLHGAKCFIEFIILEFAYKMIYVFVVKLTLVKNLIVLIST